MYTEGVYVVWSGEIIPGAPCMNCCNLILPHPVYVHGLKSISVHINFVTSIF